jgi:acetyl esterase
MPLDPQVQALRARSLASDAAPPLYTMTVEQAREADLASVRDTGGRPEPVAGTFELTIDGPGGPIPIRGYLPDQSGGPLPVLLYFFGGGWTLGTIETSDGICRRLTNTTGCLTIAVGYRLAPEHKFPAALHDCYAALRWVADHGSAYGADPDRIGVGGDSAGGNLAAAVALLARDGGGPTLRAQLLVYPNTEFGSDRPSVRENTDPAFFNYRSVRWYWGHYLADPADGANPYASPVRAPDLGGLPPALIITAEYDPLRDEGEAYGQRLRDDGVDVTVHRYDGMIHGFFAMSGVLDAARDATDEAARFLRTHLAR